MTIPFPLPALPITRKVPDPLCLVNTLPEPATTIELLLLLAFPPTVQRSVPVLGGLCFPTYAKLEIVRLSPDVVPPLPTLTLGLFPPRAYDRFETVPGVEIFS